MKKPYIKLFKLLDRILYALEMFPTKNPNTIVCRIASTAYGDGTRVEYLNGCDIKDLKRPKVTAK
jgi:hypothetical protein